MRAKSIENWPHSPPDITPTEINKKTKLRAYLREYKRRKRREVLPGFPKLPLTLTLEEIKQYLHSAEITCFLCGKAYKELGAHLSSIHKVSADQYREMYGLPYRTGLTSAPLKEWKREFGSRDEQIVHLQSVRPGDAARRVPHRISGAKQQTARLNAAKAPIPQPQVGPADALPVIEYMEREHCGLRPAAAAVGTIGATTFRRVMGEHPDLAARFKAASRAQLARRRQAVSAAANRLVCERCGKEFRRPPHHAARAKHHYCSRQCRVMGA